MNTQNPVVVRIFEQIRNCSCTKFGYLNSTSTVSQRNVVVILQNLIKAYHRKSGKSKYDRKQTELDVEITRIRSRVNGVLYI